MKVLIGADVVPTESNFDLFREGNRTKLLGKELDDIWSSADVRVFNLEVPIFDKLNPIHKCGSNLIAPKSTINGIKALNPTLVTLANNHILDHGEEGLKSTQEILKDNYIPFTGVGDDIYQARKPYIIEHNGITLGIYACAENEFTIATEKSMGANPFDPLESLDDISKLSDKCDYLIVLYHGGKEYYRYPSPYLQKVCRKIIEKGADLVICQHSHCIGSLEKYMESTIVYGQGNFIFDGDDNEFWNTSIIIQIELNENIIVDFIPICKDGNRIRLASENEKKAILDGFNKRSEDIIKPEFIHDEYKKFAEQHYPNYLTTFAGWNKLMKIINNKTGSKLIYNKYNRKKLLPIINYIECEAHRELILKALEVNK
ncbi:CapA family protein [Paraclostridium bifermentans]|uniref:CapA family protein n=1 Tax=Paraclostridium bifermentans TaxID=1490 RepID=UPI0022E3BCA6|nr:CapA family protein [Paraclostridium bifermentans]